jgi:hypothetical protein
VTPDERKQLEHDRRTLRRKEIGIERHEPTKGQKSLKFDRPKARPRKHKEKPGGEEIE